MEVLRQIGIGGIAVLACFYLIRDVIGPLVKSVTRRNKIPTEATRVTVLELNVTKLTTRVEDFGTLLAEQGQAVDNKMDIVLHELKEIRTEFSAAYLTMTERISKAETHIEHLLKTGRGRAAN